MAKTKTEELENDEEVVVIEAKKEKTAKATKPQSNGLNLFSLAGLPAFLTFIAVGLGLISLFFNVCQAFTVSRISTCLSIISLIGAVVIELINLIKVKEFKFSYKHALMAFAIFLYFV